MPTVGSYGGSDSHDRGTPVAHLSPFSKPVLEGRSVAVLLATQGPSWGYSKVNLLKIYQLLAINTHEMAPRTNQWLQERTWDTPAKGLLWIRKPEERAFERNCATCTRSSILRGGRCRAKTLLDTQNSVGRSFLDSLESSRIRSVLRFLNLRTRRECLCSGVSFP